jgi:predicted nucleic acid-binding protein
MPFMAVGRAHRFLRFVLRPLVVHQRLLAVARARLRVMCSRPVLGCLILPVSEAISERWGIFAGERQLKGRPLSVGDGLIAATALEHDLTVVTRNGSILPISAWVCLIHGTTQYDWHYRRR